jgi:hypothetical protein
MRLCALVSVLDFGHYSSLRRRFISLLQLFDLPFPALQILPTHHVYLLTFPSLGALVLPILRLMAGETGTPAVAEEHDITLVWEYHVWQAFDLGRWSGSSLFQ